jgi:thiamine kinase-like enzyme
MLVSNVERYKEDIRNNSKDGFMAIESKIAEYVRKIDPEIVGLEEESMIETKKLGLGQSNLNYLVKVDGKQFIFRINMDPNSPNKSKTEFDSLKIVEELGIAPKAFHYESSKDYFGETFIILEYLEGESLENKTIGDETAEELARTVARLHNTSIGHIRKKLRKNRSTKKAMLCRIKNRIDYINVKRKKYFLSEDWFSILLAKTFHGFNERKISIEPNCVLGHGDIAPQNVIMHDAKLVLIDWEDLGLIDAGIEIAIIFDSFDFSEEQKEKFLREYLNSRKDPTIRRRIREFWPIQLFGVFCWAVLHVFEIGEEEFHEKFIQEQDLQTHVDYAKKMFEKCRNEGIFSKKARWKSSDVFPKKYLARSFRCQTKRSCHED